VISKELDVPQITLTIYVASGKGHAEYSVNGSPFLEYASVVQLPDHADVLIRAVADYGYYFYGWGDPVIYTTEIVSFTDITASLHMELFFQYTVLDVTYAYAQGLSWICNGIDLGGGASQKIGYETEIRVSVEVVPGYEGTPLLKVNGIPYTAGTGFRVTSDVTFTVTGVSKVQEQPVLCDVTYANTQGLTWIRDGINMGRGTSEKVEYGTVIHVSADVEPGYKGTPLLRANSIPYTAGTGFRVTSDVTFTVTGVTEIQERFNVVLHAEDGGKAEGAGTYDKSAQITIRAVADEGYVFVKWSDNNTSQERMITVNSDVELTASFKTALAPEGNEDEPGGDGISLAVYGAIAVMLLGAACAALWFFRFRTP